MQAGARLIQIVASECWLCCIKFCNHSVTLTLWYRNQVLLTYSLIHFEWHLAIRTFTELLVPESVVFVHIVLLDGWQRLQFLAKSYLKTSTHSIGILRCILTQGDWSATQFDIGLLIGRRGHSVCFDLFKARVRSAVDTHVGKACVPIQTDLTLRWLWLQYLCLVRPLRTFNLPLSLIFAEVFDQIFALNSVDERFAKIVMAHEVAYLAIGCTWSPMNGKSTLLRHEGMRVAAVDIFKADLLLLLLNWDFYLVSREALKLRIAKSIIDACA